MSEKSTNKRYRYETTDASTYELLLENAKANRNHPTVAESLLWNQLKQKQLGVRFRRQHPVEGYIPDFLCIRKKLIVEVDGGYHLYGNQMLNDAERTAFLEQFGYKVIRFTNEQIYHQMENVLHQIKEELESRSDK